MNVKHAKIINLELNNFKNVEHGAIQIIDEFDVLNNKGSILGIYGQNGSGKTSVIDAVGFISKFVYGDDYDYIAPYLNVNNPNMSISLDMYLELTNSHKYLVNYFLEFTKNNDVDDKVFLSRESLSYKLYENGGWNKIRGLIDNDYSSGLKPKYRIKELSNEFYNKSFDMNVDLAVARENKKSFIFKQSLVDKIVRSNTDSEYEIIPALKSIFASSVFAAGNINFALIDANIIMPVAIPCCVDGEDTIRFLSIDMYEPCRLKKHELDMVQKSLVVSNKVLSEIIPGLTVALKEVSSGYTDEEGEFIQVELMSCRANSEINTKYESEGIKKIVSTLHMLIAVYNDPACIVLVDELDSKIFEYMLGEILDVLEEGIQGQLIFTSHNLRPLEVLDKNSVVVTTSNPMNKYIYMKNVPTSHNLRNIYYRSIELGGQDEQIYDPTNIARISRAFRHTRGVCYE